MKLLFAAGAVLIAWLFALQAAAEPSPEALALAQRLIIVDGHLDTPTRMIEDGADIASGDKTRDFDYARAKAGGLDAPFMAIYVPAKIQNAGGAKAWADILIGLMEGVVEEHSDKFEIATSPKDIRRLHEEGKIALPMGIENGAAIEGDLANLKHFYERGVRYITLTHYEVNHISDSSSQIEKRWGGLSPFGFRLVRAMNDIGVMIDVSHLSDGAIEDILATTRAPIIASHSSMRHFTPGFERNLSDELVRGIGENGGVVMIAFGSIFLHPEGKAYSDARKAAQKVEEGRMARKMSEEEENAFAAAWGAAHPYPYADFDDILDHIDRAVEIAGIDHVGVGADFDGVGDSLPEGAKDVSSYPALIDGLLARGYTVEEIGKILGGNILRVWQEVEDARKKRKWR